MKLAIILILVASTATAQLVNYEEVTLRVEQFTKLDTCELIFDTIEFNGEGKTLDKYMDYLSSSCSEQSYLALYSPELLTQYPIRFKGRKGCIHELMGEALYGTDLVWELVKTNILIYRRK